jgi:hypothetical protein
LLKVTRTSFYRPVLNKRKREISVYTTALGTISKPTSGAKPFRTAHSDAYTPGAIVDDIQIIGGNDLLPCRGEASEKQ